MAFPSLVAQQKSIYPAPQGVKLHVTEAPSFLFHFGTPYSCFTGDPHQVRSCLEFHFRRVENYKEKESGLRARAGQLN